MALQQQLGKMRKEENLRLVWPNEAYDFTPWLAEEENLDLLGDALGIPLTWVETESSVGAYSLDILAEHSDSGAKVIIENQLEPTNHDHLGKIITYASGKDAKYIVWVVKEAREEHRAAIEWLNKITEDDVGFFLVEIQLWRIDDSVIAPKFEVVEQPNGWSKMVKTPADPAGGKAVQFKYAFWSAFNDYAWTKNNAFTHLFNQHKASGDHWYTLAIGLSRMYMTLLVNTRTNILTVEFAISSPNYDKTLYDAVFAHKSEIEQAAGIELDWRRLDDKKVSRIVLEKEFDLDDASDRPTQFDWYMEWAVKIHNAFKPYKNLV